MKILITGVAGLIGSNLASYYSNKGYHVIGIDSLIGGYDFNIPDNIEFHKLDCSDFKNINKLMKDVDLVLHCAALAHEGLSVFSPHLICNNIVSSSVSVFSAAINNKVKKILYFSSMARYGNNEVPFTEDLNPKPADPYGISKVASEDILANLCSAHGSEYNIIVPHNVIGPNQKYNDPFRNVVSIFINRMLQNKAPIIYGDGQQKRCFSDIEDCIYCIDKIALDKNNNSEIFNIGPDEEFITINELAEKLINKMRVNFEPIYQPDRKNEVKLANCSANKVREYYNYQTKIELDESLDRIIKFIKKNGPKEFDYSFNLEILNEDTPKTWSKKLI